MTDTEVIQREVVDVPSLNTSITDYDLLTELIVFEAGSKQFSTQELSKLHAAIQDSPDKAEYEGLLSTNQKSVLKQAEDLTKLYERIEAGRAYGIPFKEIDKAFVELKESADPGLLSEADPLAQKFSALQRYKVARENGVGGAKSNLVAKVEIRNREDLDMVNSLVEIAETGTPVKEEWVSDSSQSTRAGALAVVEAFREGQQGRALHAAFIAASTLVQSGQLTTVKTTANLLNAQSPAEDRSEIEKKLTQLLIFDQQYGVDVGKNILLHLKHLADPDIGRGLQRTPVSGLTEFLDGPMQAIRDIRNVNERQGLEGLNNRTKGKIEGYLFELSAAVSLIRAGFNVKEIGARSYNGEELRTPANHVASGTPREIDIIAEKGGRDLFIEVKARTQTFLSTNSEETNALQQVDSLQYLADKHGAVAVILIHDAKDFHRHIDKVSRVMTDVHHNLGIGHPAVCDRNGGLLMQANENALSKN